MLSININKLRSEVELREQKKCKVFDNILELCYQRILNSNQKHDDYSCTYIVPNVVFGLPLYDINDCVSFIINKLIDKGFDVVYTYPTTIHISWKPKIKNDKYEKNDKNDKYANSQSRNNNQLSILNKNNKTNMQSNMQSNTQPNNKYKSINDYKNTENLIYDTNDINLFQSKLNTIFD